MADAGALARIVSLGGPVLDAETREGHFSVNEAVHVGEARLLGEVLKIRGARLTVQIYEDTSGLRPGDPVRGQGAALSVRLGPGLLGGIYDGLLRPLDLAGSHVAAGMLEQPARCFAFEPLLERDQILQGGERLGWVTAGEEQRQACLVPPWISGRVLWRADAGDLAADECVARVATDQGTVEVAPSHRWPVRRPRPVRQRLEADQPLFTGQRIIDFLYPVAQGGKAALPGGFGTGKTILLQTLAKWCDADVIIYIGCGERGNEMSAVLREFPELEDPRTGRPLMERSVIIANTSNMPVAAREASIYTGVTVAEYFRDQGLHTALFADSTSRWAEALREISGRLGELPTEGGYPAYLPSRKAEFYERAARVECLGGGSGSVTLMGAISPPGGDFSEPVTLHTQRNVPCFWPLDRDRAQARFYPAINPLSAYSEYVEDLEGWWRRAGNPEWPRQRRRLLKLLEEEAHLERMARIVGRDALPEGQQLTLLEAGIVNDVFLRQNAFSAVDRHASAERQTAMMRVIEAFLDLSEAALERGVPVDKLAALGPLRALRRMSEDIPEEDTPAGHARLRSALEAAIGELEAQLAGEGAA